ncbi:bifunctional UDP-N-acetylglucosamine diphosphorylase/glucosamine-1-phosphate N-acetyltransferase GlmU [Vagococcus acidifermentans]|uniref:Bifunctional protein GlmU n=1 Tax=Vagococcus acidifermentans TaxID=564710 RepID=A0A430B2J2_9ENTE|nr:bifunctional UDP-N-acetylglucosamine diphosphorylase/glucosamine-1-phosphate N-acetyltransferase GlmU [Vagococcus acidifermentans]RSU14543.1 UDP-N-acetylglucosamine diphosphorylase/glucosamine-1-phosphate N-acetyltransferase [Vagococcus acidifermentans]
MTNRYAVILAAGQGSRMKSSLYKVLHPVAGKPMVELVMTQVEQLDVEQIVTVVGFGADKVRESLGDRSDYVLQEEQLGTGHAVMQTRELLADKTGTTLVICGDTPLLTAATLEQLFAHHEAAGAKATILSAIAADPSHYGRVVRNADNHVEKIVEHKDANPSELTIKEFNTGTYCFDNAALFSALEKVGNDNAQGEYYLPDVIGILKQAGDIVSAYIMDSEEESMGINDRAALAKANKLMRQRVNHELMQQGVTFIDPDTAYVDVGVTIGQDTVIEPGVSLKGDTTIGSHCVIGAHSEIVDSKIGDGVRVTSSMIEKSAVADGADVGPYAHLRPLSEIGENVHIGNFVEVKKSSIAKNTKVGHLTYVGDATLGENINVGCGTVFVNYDGKNKHHTHVGDNVFIGCNANLVAPVTLGDGSFVAAGSTITEDVPGDALAIARERQTNLKNYAKKLPYNS